MEIDNYTLFCQQLAQAVNKYPNLRINELEGIKYLKGILEVPNDNQEIVGSFLIEVHFTKGFPKRFPMLLEIGNNIPNEAKWHKYHNDACCITVTAEEMLFCRLGISVSEFIEKHAIAFLANFIYRKINGVYKNGEYRHWVYGPKQFYTELLKTEDQILWLRYFDHVFNASQYDCERNKRCFCGSRKKFKLCHKTAFETLFDIGRKQVAEDFDTIMRVKRKIEL